MLTPLPTLQIDPPFRRASILYPLPNLFLQPLACRDLCYHGSGAPPQPQHCSSDSIMFEDVRGSLRG